MTTPDPLDPQSSAHDCTDDPGPVHSFFAAMALLMITDGCSAEDCLMRARAEQARARTRADGRSPRMCESGLEEVVVQRMYERTTTHAVWEASAARAFCRIDPGLVDRDHARTLVRLHHRCDETRCRPKMRGLQALEPVRFRCPPPRCRIPDAAITSVVAKYHATTSVLRAAKEDFYAHKPGAQQSLVSAIAEYAAARRRRDSLFLQALPEDGAIPTVVIKKFRIDRIDMYRLIPALDQPLPLLGGRAAMELRYNRDPRER
ncbi:hypothetical protein ACFU44_22975 [Nocardia rhizosphaerihabitans]|uniref:hypothetical protein n=1 Tax=Nocardia rhizosphaerihabitans TaxID=1691570 RepID=UPI00366A6D0E